MRKDLTPALNSEHDKYNEEKLIFKALYKNQPVTRRELSNATNIEIASLCRVLFNLVYYTGQVKIAYRKKCPNTGRTVMHFALKNWEG
ncbi:hypothetical protein H8S90_21255 [Olivibacter sp. SDN3]|uniref:hypothetical protein n=1 Tax=Olivibacter sp. SDN3 TaxID=2764720 RepID=UPI0016513348|nr:hypothetical protein [Olivibacter sp. SDN3]QNL49240.1 hypothetical protein H8S90_21255 [Olivibacter sp. SDN3]